MSTPQSLKRGNTSSGTAASMRRAMLAATIAVTMNACGSSEAANVTQPPSGQSPTPAAVASVELNRTALDIDEGATAQLSATVKDAAGNVLTGRTISWASSDTRVATVLAGQVTGVVEGDTVSITATSEGKSASTRVVVRSLFFLTTSFGTNYDHSCAVRATGGLYCWGFNYGQLGNAANVTLGARLPVTSGAAFVQTASGNRHTCALDALGAAFCWGVNDDGQLGNGTFVSTNAPVAVSGQLRFTQIYAGFGISCGIVASGAAYCWGTNFWGSIGTSGVGPFNTPQLVSGGLSFRKLAVYFTHVCGLTTQGSAVCWGDNSTRQLGDSTGTRRTSPVPVYGNISFTDVAVGDAHSCGIDATGAAWCWGSNSRGKLGVSTDVTLSGIPVRVSGTTPFARIAAGRNHTCALAATTGEAYCWGSNDDAQLGTGDRVSSATPVRVSGGTAFTEIRSANGHSCALTASRRIACWGANLYGQQGILANGSVTVPTFVARP